MILRDVESIQIGDFSDKRSIVQLSPVLDYISDWPLQMYRLHSRRLQTMSIVTLQWVGVTSSTNVVL